MDTEGLFGGLIELEIASEMMHCLNCGSLIKKGHKCKHCKK